jgi:hypothetical protein
MQSESPSAAKERDRRVVVRDMFVFQFKLIVDGVLDLVLLPVSLVVGLISLVGPGPGWGSEFYEFLRIGRRGERWINLFGAVERKHGSASDADEFATKDLDDLVSRVESFLVDEYRNRAVTTQTRQRLDAALESLQTFSKQRNRSKPD